MVGHIPGALNRPFNLNIGADGRFRLATELRAEFDALLGGSAVTNILAMGIAGLGRTALFAGSWSEWCSDPAVVLRT